MFHSKSLSNHRKFSTLKRPALLNIDNKKKKNKGRKRGIVSYHAQISLKVKENLVLPDIPQLGHIVGK